MADKYHRSKRSLLSELENAENTNRLGLDDDDIDIDQSTLGYLGRASKRLRNNIAVNLPHAINPNEVVLQDEPEAQDEPIQINNNNNNNDNYFMIPVDDAEARDVSDNENSDRDSIDLENESRNSSMYWDDDDFQAVDAEEDWENGAPLLPDQEDPPGQDNDRDDGIPFIEGTFIDDPNYNDPVNLGSAVSKGQALVLLIAFILRHGLSDSAVQDLLEYLQLCFNANLPATRYFLGKEIRLKQGLFEAHLFCIECDGYIGKYDDVQIDRCGHCEALVTARELLRKGAFFLYLPLQPQLKGVLRKLEVKKKSVSLREQTRSSMMNGDVIRELVLEGKITDSDLTLLFNTDGAPLFKSSKRAVWPLQGRIVELGEDFKNNFLIGVHFYHKKPDSHTFFQPFIEEMNTLSDDGFEWLDLNGQRRRSRVFALCCSCDNPARTLINGTTQYNGLMGCDWCLDEGLLVERGAGRARIYLPNEDRIQRRDDLFREDAIIATSQHPVNGVKFPAPFLLLKHFDVIRGIVPDYLHCFLIGVTKMFMELFFDSSNHREPWYLGLRIQNIDRKLLLIKPPSTISRLPRSLTMRKYYKGNEYEAWLLYYSLVVLDGELPVRYYKHWFLFVYATHLLTQEELTRQDIDLADVILNDFVADIPALYGQGNCTYNVHVLSHVAGAVKDWGPVHRYSCFYFESTIGECVKLVKGSNGVAAQISRKFLMRRALPVLIDKLFVQCDVRTLHLVTKLSCSGCYIRKNRYSIDGVHLYGSAITHHLTDGEKDAIQLYIQQEVRNIKCYKTFSVNGTYLTTTEHRELRTLDSCVELTNGQCGTVANCIVGRFCDCQRNCECDERVLIMIRPFRNSNRTLCRVQVHDIDSTPFLKVMVVDTRTPLICVSPLHISRKCLLHKSGDYHIVAPMHGHNYD